MVEKNHVQAGIISLSYVPRKITSYHICTKTLDKEIHVVMLIHIKKNKYIFIFLILTIFLYNFLKHRTFILLFMPLTA